MINSLKKAGYVLTPLIVYYVVHDVVRLLLMFVLQFTAQHSQKLYDIVLNNSPLFSGIISALDMIIGAVAVVILIRYDSSELALEDYFNLNGLSFYRKDKLHPAWISWGIIALQGFFAAVGLNSLLSLTGIVGASSSYENASKAQYALPVWLGIIIYGLISPMVEEFLFRLVIFGRMKRRFSYLISILVTSVFFGLYHGNMVQGIYGTLMGILMCLACEYVHSVLGAFAVHSIANLSIYLLGVCGMLGKFNNIKACVIFLLAAVLLLGLELGFTASSRKKLGVTEGIVPVGCFYIDPAYEYEEDDDDE